MTATETTPSANQPAAGGTFPARDFTPFEGTTLSLLLALTGTFLVGYRFGDSNHGITVPILKRFMDPSLYPGDVMVATAERFPTIFYRGLAALLPSTDWIPFAFFVLYVLSIAATLAGAYRIGRWAGGPAAGILTLIIVYPVRIGLAGEALYRVAFSHSHLASALTIWAIVWFLEGRRLLPILVLSLGAYNHLLYSLYALVPMGLVVFTEFARAGVRRTATLLAAAGVPLLPLAYWAVSRGTPMTAEWLQLLRLRSSHHSFPGAFGGDLPEAACLLALAVLTFSRWPEDRKRMAALFLAATALQFVFGSFFTEWIPLKAVLQYQPHRCWRFLVLILQGAAAAGVVAGYREGGTSRWGAIFTGLVITVPGLEPLLPLAVLVQVAVVCPRPAPWALVSALATIALVPGWGDREVDLAPAGEFFRRFLSALPLTTASLIILALLGREWGAEWRARVVSAVAAITLLWLGPHVYGRARQRWESGPWREAQNWVRRNTPRDAVILTPPREAGFRVFSERTIVGEWKDGTQQYFDDAFVKEWGRRMDGLGPAPYEKHSVPELLEFARRYGASYIVLPARPRRRALALVHRNQEWAVYQALPARSGE